MSNSSASVTGSDGVAPEPQFSLYVSDGHGRYGYGEWQALAAKVNEIVGEFPNREPGQVINGGDRGDRDPWLDWVDSLAGLWTQVCALGNHDGHYPTNAERGTVEAPPFDGQGYGVIEKRDALICLTNNVSPHEIGGEDVYHNLNPPGDYTGNPDYSGWSDPNSPQRQFMREQLQASDKPWKIVVGHRPYLAPWATDGVQRPLYPTTEPLGDLGQAGANIYLGGDIHITSMTYSASAYHIVTKGGFSNREPKYLGMFGLNYDWDFIAPRKHMEHQLHGFLFRFQAEQCYLQIIGAERDAEDESQGIAYVEEIDGEEGIWLERGGAS